MDTLGNETTEYLSYFSAFGKLFKSVERKLKASLFQLDL